jgi:hypothetical protein
VTANDSMWGVEKKGAMAAMEAPIVENVER